MRLVANSHKTQAINWPWYNGKHLTLTGTLPDGNCFFHALMQCIDCLDNLPSCPFRLRFPRMDYTHLSYTDFRSLQDYFDPDHQYIESLDECQTYFADKLRDDLFAWVSDSGAETMLDTLIGEPKYPTLTELEASPEYIQRVHELSVTMSLDPTHLLASLHTCFLEYYPILQMGQLVELGPDLTLQYDFERKKAVDHLQRIVPSITNYSMLPSFLSENMSYAYLAQALPGRGYIGENIIRLIEYVFNLRIIVITAETTCIRLYANLQRDIEPHRKCIVINWCDGNHYEAASDMLTGSDPFVQACVQYDPTYNPSYDPTDDLADMSTLNLSDDEYVNISPLISPRCTPTNLETFFNDRKDEEEEEVKEVETQTHLTFSHSVKPYQHNINNITTEDDLAAYFGVLQLHPDIIYIERFLLTLRTFPVYATYIAKGRDFGVGMSLYQLWDVYYAIKGLQMINSNLSPHQLYPIALATPEEWVELGKSIVSPIA